MLSKLFSLSSDYLLDEDLDLSSLDKIEENVDEKSAAINNDTYLKDEKTTKRSNKPCFIY